MTRVEGMTKRQISLQLSAVIKEENVQNLADFFLLLVILQTIFLYSPNPGCGDKWRLLSSSALNPILSHHTTNFDLNAGSKQHMTVSHMYQGV